MAKPKAEEKQLLRCCGKAVDRQVEVKVEAKIRKKKQVLWWCGRGIGGTS
jgi:hypothetical protein